MKTDITWVHVTYGEIDHKLERSNAQRVFRALGVSGNIILVHNDQKTTDCDCWCVVGSNEHREFSGWGEGVCAALERIESRGKLWIFSNDTYSAHRYFWGSVLSGFSRALALEELHSCPLIIADVLPPIVPGFGSYFSTYLFIMNEQALKKLNYDFTAGVAHDWIATSEELVLTSSKCPKNISSFLHAHLLSPQSSSAWYGAEPLHRGNLHQMRFKALAILLEQQLSKRVLSEDVQLRPIIDRESINLGRIRRSLESRIERARAKC